LASDSVPRSLLSVAEMSRYIAGEVIADKYRLVRPLAEGGMGALWVAQNLALDVQVALKLIRADIASESASERLLNEARTAARLKHPSIVRIFDFGRTHRDDPFIVMELLRGQNLGELLNEQRRLPATYTAQLLLPIAEALAAAHRQAIVHRDLKPDNVFLADGDGRLQPKIVDFGIAMLAQRSQDGRITRDGAVLGSPEYMSPEQARGAEDIDQRADIWAFSVMLYECVTGNLPFSEANYHALLSRIIEEEPASILQHSAGDTELWHIVQRGLCKNRDQRWQNIRELGETLAAWLVERGVTEDICGHSLRASWLDGRSFTTEEVNSGLRRIPSPNFARAAALDEAPLNVAGADPDAAPTGRRTRSRMVLAGAVAFAFVGLFSLGALQRSYTNSQNSTREPEHSIERAAGPSKIAPVGAVVQPTRALAPLPHAKTDSGARTSALENSKSGAPTQENASATSTAAPAKPPAKRQPRTRDRKRNSTYEDLGF